MNWSQTTGFSFGRKGNYAFCLTLGPALFFGHFALATNYTLVTSANFDNTTGEYPESALLRDPSGNFYGTAYRGGTHGDGTVFEIPAGTNTITTLYNFSGADGNRPQGNLVIDSSGNLYGTTTQGGTHNSGTVFELAANTNTLTTLVNFDSLSNGASPHSLTIDSSNNIYGTTSQGGSTGYGTVFEIPASTRTLTTLVTFNLSNGANPVNPLTLDKSGNIYGTTNYGGATTAGGATGGGTAFEIAAGTHTLTTLASFNADGHGVVPSSALSLDSQGNIYGTTGGGDGTTYDGAVFKIAAGTNQLSNLVTVVTSNGDGPQGLIRDPVSGILYGATPGVSQNATIFEVTPGSNSLTTLFTFNGANGSNPNQLFSDGMGHLYGTTILGGSGGFGTFFELVPEPSSIAIIAGASMILLRRRST